MSLDFAITQFYRLVVDDLIAIYDTYLFYTRYRKSHRSLKEFSEVLANLMQVEAQNFEDIDETRLSHNGEEERVEYVIRDYLMSVVMRYVLDDVSQFPFWSAKIAILSSVKPKPFGRSVITEFWNYLKEKIASRQFRKLYEGIGPYLCASFIINFDYISKSTNNFIVAMLSKIPRPPPKPPSLQDASQVSNNISNNESQLKVSKINLPAAIQTLKGSPGKSKSAKNETGIQWFDYVKKIVTDTLSHPFLVLSVSMVSDPLLQGDNWFFAYVKFVANYGIQPFYNGLRTRAIFSLLPLSPILLLGINDTLIYRKMLDHRLNLSENFFTVARELTNNSEGERNSLFNYGLLTAFHVIPGFLSFMGMRLLAWLTFGSSIHRKNQISRRKEIVQAHIMKIKKRSSKGGLLSPIASPTQE